jgi:23S rRNA U2552 (ribose-2'-O)-methylase RlmE/FtsJ
MTLHRLRIELPDTPGALARAASAIAGVGGNVLSVDIHEIDGHRSVDEIVVDLPDDCQAETISAGLTETAAGTLLSMQAGSTLVDPIVRALRWVGFALLGDPQDSDLTLAQSLAEMCTSAAAWVWSPEEASRLLAGRRALALGHAVVTSETDLPTEVSADLPDSAWVMAVPDDPEHPLRVGFAARAHSLPFTASEVARAHALMSVCHQLSVATAWRSAPERQRRAIAD